MKVTRFHHVSVNANDAPMEDMVGFYRDVLGLGDKTRPEIPGRAWSLARRGRSGAAPGRRPAARGAAIDSDRATTTASSSTISTAPSPSSKRAASSTCAPCRVRARCRSGSADPAGNTIELQQDTGGRMTFIAVRPPGARRLRRARSHLRPQRPRPTSTIPTSRWWRSSTRAKSAAPNARPTGPRPGPSRRWPSWRRAGSRSTPSRRCSRSRCTPTAWSSCSATGGTSTCRSPCATTWPSAQRMLDAAEANDRLLRVMENYLFYEPLRRLKEIVESRRASAR